MSKDIIYREDAIKALDNAWINGTSLLDANEAVKQLNDLPSADRPQGNWVNVKISISGDSSAECSLCGAVVHNNFSNAINFCPNCGADMREVRDE